MRTARWVVLGLFVLPALALGATPLESAKAQVAKLDYASARKTLKAAEAQEGYSRDELLDLLELQGVVEGSLNDAKAAKAAFLRLLVLEPGRKLKGHPAPRVTTPFFEAKGEVADKGALAVTATPPALEGFDVRGVGFAVSGDFLHWAKTVRVHVRENGEAWRVVDGAPPTVTVPTRSPRVEAWAEVLTEKRWTLALAGTEAAPVVAEALRPPPPPEPKPAPVAAATTPADAPHANALVPAGAPGASVHAAVPVAAGSSGALRTVGVVTMVAGALALGAGGYFAWDLSWQQDRVAHAAKDPAGNVTGLTRAEAVQLDTQTRSDAFLANAGFVAGGVLLAAGGAMALFGGPSAPAPAVALTPQGAVVGVSGVWP